MMKGYGGFDSCSIYSVIESLYNTMRKKKWIRANRSHFVHTSHQHFYHTCQTKGWRCCYNFSTFVSIKPQTDLFNKASGQFPAVFLWRRNWSSLARPRDVSSYFKPKRGFCLTLTKCLVVRNPIQSITTLKIEHSDMLSFNISDVCRNTTSS